MSYKYESILKSFEYSKENYQIISDFLLSGDITNPDILLNITKISKEFGKRPVKWFELETTISFIKALLKIKIKGDDKKLKRVFIKFLKSDNYIEVLEKLNYKELVKLSKDIGLISVKKGGNGKHIQGTWLHRDLIEEYLKWLVGEKSLKQPNGLYLIQAGEYTKIGITQDIDKRLKSMETDNPLKLKVLFYQKFENVNKLESFLHKSLKKFNIKNEWFKLSKSQINTITKHLKSNNLSELENYLSIKNKTKINKKERQIKILEILKESSFTAKELAEKLNISTSTIYSDLKNLLKKEKLSKVKSGRSFVYFLKANTIKSEHKEKVLNYEI